MSNKTPAQLALEALRKDADREGDAKPEAYIADGEVVARQGGDAGPYVDLSVVDMEFVDYSDGALDLTTGYQTLPVIDIAQFRYIAFSYEYSPSAAGSILALIPEVRIFRGSTPAQARFAPMSVLDGVLVPTVPAGLTQRYGARTMYPNIFLTDPAIDTTLIPGVIPYAVDDYMAIRVRVAEISPGVEAGAVIIRYATVR